MIRLELLYNDSGEQVICEIGSGGLPGRMIELQ